MTTTDISDETADRIIDALNKYAVDYDDYQHGLPMGDHHREPMRALVRAALAAADAERA